MKRLAALILAIAMPAMALSGSSNAEAFSGLTFRRQLFYNRIIVGLNIHRRQHHEQSP